MAPPAVNIFQRLHKWAARQDENFLTESLAVVLEQLLVLDPETGVWLVEELTRGFIGVPATEANRLQIRTQVIVDSGRPDLVIKGPGKLVWIEVKVESDFSVGQLEKYRTRLGTSGIEQTKLGILTRYAIQHNDETHDYEFRWFEVANCFETAVNRLRATGQNYDPPVQSR